MFESLDSDKDGKLNFNEINSGTDIGKEKVTLQNRVPNYYGPFPSAVLVSSHMNIANFDKLANIVVTVAQTGDGQDGQEQGWENQQD